MKALLNDEAEMEDLFETIESDEEFENAGMNSIIPCLLRSINHSLT
jgi:hypothetical protein